MQLARTPANPSIISDCHDQHLSLSAASAATAAAAAPALAVWEDPVHIMSVRLSVDSTVYTVSHKNVQSTPAILGGFFTFCTCRNK